MIKVFLNWFEISRWDFKYIKFGFKIKCEMTGYFANKILINSLWKKGSLKASLDDTLKQL